VVRQFVYAFRGWAPGCPTFPLGPAQDFWVHFWTRFQRATSPTNWKGQSVKLPKGHLMSPHDPAFSAKPIVDAGPFTTAQRAELLRGKNAGTHLSPHHRHQVPTTHGGVIDEVPGHGHSSGNIHTGISPTRHPGPSVFNPMEGGEALRAKEIRDHWRTKGERLVEVEPGVWVDPGF